jgi:hypothetical protein
MAHTQHTGAMHAMFGQCEENMLPSCKHCCMVNLTTALNGIEDGSGVAFKCSHGKCATWNALDSSFHFPVPKGYPTTCDLGLTSPKPPNGRDVVGNKRSASQLSNDMPDNGFLCTIPLSIPWLKEAIRFSHHNMKKNL